MKILKESTLLVEKFSESMPSWLRKIISTRMQREKKGWVVGNFSSRTSSEDSLPFRKISRDVEIDFNKANFIEVPVPSKIDEIRNNASRLYFLHIIDATDSDLCYIPGINDEEKFHDVTKDGSIKELAFKYFNSAMIKRYAKDLCYLEVSDSNNYSTDKRIDRKNISDEIKEIPNYYRSEMDYSGRRLKNNPTNKYNYGNYRYDASGYLVVPPALKYAEKLKEMKRGNVGENLEKLYADILKARKTYVSAISELDILELDAYSGTAAASNVKQSLTSIGRAIDCYKSALNYINKASKADASSLIEDRNYYIDEAGEYINRSNYYLREANKYLSDFIKSTIDWEAWDEDEED